MRHDLIADLENHSCSYGLCGIRLLPNRKPNERVKEHNRRRIFSFDSLHVIWTGSPHRRGHHVSLFSASRLVAAVKREPPKRVECGAKISCCVRAKGVHAHFSVTFARAKLFDSSIVRQNGKSRVGDAETTSGKDVGGNIERSVYTFEDVFICFSCRICQTNARSMCAQV